MTAGLVLLLAGAGAGMFGSLLGLGGGILLVPLLTLGFGRPLREAVAISLVSVIVTSSAGAGVYLRRHVANLRLGMTLELFTAIGALAGGLIAFSLPVAVLEGLFALLLGYVAVTMLRRRDPSRGPATAPAVTPIEDDAAATLGVADGPDPAPASSRPPVATPARAVPTSALDDLAAHVSGPGYRVSRLRFGMGGAVFAGVVSALLGVGGGIVKVPLMSLVMNVPLKVATATSNMMIGITATSSAVIYLLRGEINPYIAGPVAVGVFVGASIGARVINRIDTRVLRLLFVVVLIVTAIQMAAKAVGL